MITLRNLQLRRGTKIVLDGVNVNINPGEKVGLVGRNGAGKSSLFALLAGRLQADQGDFEIPARWRLGEVAQNMPETEQSATDFVLEGDIPLMLAQRELEAAFPALDVVWLPTQLHDDGVLLVTRAMLAAGLPKSSS